MKILQWRQNLSVHLRISYAQTYECSFVVVVVVAVVVFVSKLNKRHLSFTGGGRCMVKATVNDELLGTHVTSSINHDQLKPAGIRL